MLEIKTSHFPGSERVSKMERKTGATHYHKRKYGEKKRKGGGIPCVIPLDFQSRENSPLPNTGFACSTSLLIPVSPLIPPATGAEKPEGKGKGEEERTKKRGGEKTP